MRVRFILQSRLLKMARLSERSLPQACRWELPKLPKLPKLSERLGSPTTDTFGAGCLRLGGLPARLGLLLPPCPAVRHGWERLETLPEGGEPFRGWGSIGGPKPSFGRCLGHGRSGGGEKQNPRNPWHKEKTTHRKPQKNKKQTCVQF